MSLKPTLDRPSCKRSVLELFLFDVLQTLYFAIFATVQEKKSSFVECFTISLCGIEQTLFVLNFNLNFVPTLDQLQQRDLL